MEFQFRKRHKLPVDQIGPQDVYAHETHVHKGSNMLRREHEAGKAHQWNWKISPVKLWLEHWDDYLLDSRECRLAMCRLRKLGPRKCSKLSGIH